MKIQLVQFLPDSARKKKRGMTSDLHSRCAMASCVWNHSFRLPALHGQKALLSLLWLLLVLIYVKMIVCRASFTSYYTELCFAFRFGGTILFVTIKSFCPTEGRDKYPMTWQGVKPGVLSGR